jgi:alkylation response protein AidB-like acyl-CoA dehydrogenase
MADMASNLTAARQLVRSTAQTLDSDVSLEEKTASSAMAKILGTEIGFQVCNDALQLFGGYGYLKDYQPQRYLRDLRHHTIAVGTNESLRLIIANNLLLQK